MDYHQLEKEINKLWNNGIMKNGNHIFFKDIKTTEININNYRKAISEYYNIKTYPTTIQECSSLLLKKYPKIKLSELPKPELNNPLTFEDIIDMAKYLKNNEPDSVSILKMIHDIKNRPLPSSIELSDYIKFLKNNKKTKNEKRFLIMGAGPNGLFIAILLNHIFNNKVDGIENVPNAKILVIDNRITEEGFRQPYTRTRVFVYSSILLTYLYKYLYCKNPLHNQGGQINYIEYLGYIELFNLGIPICFTNKYETKESIMKLIDECNFDVLFDGTGGRLNITNISSSYPLNKELPIKKNGYILERNGGNEIILKSEITNNPYTMIYNIQLFDKDKEYIGYRDLFTLYTCDIKLYGHYSDGLINKKQIEKIEKLIKDPIDKIIIHEVIKKNRNIKYLRIQPIPVYMHHLIKLAEVMKTKKNKEFLYIASGDTLFHSHFVTGAGINRLFNFITRIVYKL